MLILIPSIFRAQFPVKIEADTKIFYDPRVCLWPTKEYFLKKGKQMLTIWIDLAMLLLW
jgi:hypothetical protein